jgi:dTMP kinase
MKKEGKGLFIVIEGNDGAGKTTQRELLGNYLRELGKEVYLTREPSDSEYGRRIKALVVSDEGNKLSDDEWLELFTLDRKEHLKKEVLPDLEQGKIVICDRYDYSTCIYQLKDENKWKEYMPQFLRPDLTFIILVPTKIAMQRLHSRDRKITVFEKERMIEERREKYERIALIGDNIKKIDGSRDIEGVFAQIKGEIDKFLGLE